MALTPRQLTILGVVTEQFIRMGSPVSSKAVAQISGLKASPSTIRNEFAVLEEQGYLTHPHTSAGRTPTSLGYREYVDRLLRSGVAVDAISPPLPAAELAREVDDALRQTSEAMSEATNLLALVVAPLASGARLRHVELILLQNTLVMIVFILSTGRVSKAIVDFSERVDPGMVEWARSYLNELMGDRNLTERLYRRVLENPELGIKERIFLAEFVPAFKKLLDESSSEALYIGGAARLLSEADFGDVGELRDLLKLLEERYLLLRTLRSALSRGEVLVRIGDEHQEAALRRFSMVAASYGLPQRSLGTVSLLGPLRMDYESAIVTVRGTAHLLSTFLEDRYE
jgi:heat-inducible transcriptional repressor